MYRGTRSLIYAEEGEEEEEEGDNNDKKGSHTINHSDERKTSYNSQERARQ